MKLNPMIVFREDFEDTAILFNPDDGEVLSLNETAAFIWKELEKGFPADQILVHMKDACGSTFPAAGEAEIQSFLSQLKEKKFILD